MHRSASGAARAVLAATVVAGAHLWAGAATAQVAVEQITPRAGRVQVDQIARPGPSVFLPQLPAQARLRVVPAEPARTARDLLVVGQPTTPAISTRPVPATPAAFQPPRLPNTYGGVQATVAPSTTVPRLPSTGEGLQGPVEN